MQYEQIINLLKEANDPGREWQQEQDDAAHLFETIAEKLRQRGYKQYRNSKVEVFNLLKVNIDFPKFNMFRHPKAGPKATLLGLNGAKQMNSESEFIEEKGKDENHGKLYEWAYENFAVGLFEITNVNNKGTVPNKGDIALYMRESIDTPVEYFDPK